MIRGLPHDVDAERSTLGSMMLSQSACGLSIEMLSSAAFFTPMHGRIFATIESLYAAGQPVDSVTVKNAMEKAGTLPDPGYLIELVEAVPSPASIGHYAQIVAERARLRAVIEACELAAAELRAVPSDVPEALEVAASKVTAAARAPVESEALPLGADIGDVLRKLERIHQGIDGNGMGTGLAGLDDYIGGLQPGQLVTVAARPRVGKSSLLAQIGVHVAGQGVPVMMCSLEMSRAEILMRMLCSEAGVSLAAVRSPRAKMDDWARLTDACDRLSELPMSLVDRGRLTVADIRAKAMRRREKVGLGLVLVDYLQILPVIERHRDRRDLELADITTGLKALAMDMGICVVLASQLNRAIESRSGGVPQLSDLRDSGSIEADSDIVIFITRGAGKAAELHIAKQRSGGEGKIAVVFEAPFTRFLDA